MRRIAVLNQKGGVGKTTTTANLGAALARAGWRVLLIDLDPQGHLSLHFGVELRDEESSLYDVLTGSMPVNEVARKVHDRITLIPADIDLAGAEAELVSITGREVLLREALESVKGEFDFLMIDCPPSLGVLTINALVAAEEVIIPLQAHFLALQGLSRLFDTVTLVRQRINPNLAVGGIVLCMHESTTRLAGEVADDLLRFLQAARGTGVPWADARVYQTCIRRNIKLAESSSFGQTIFDYAPRSNGAADYAALAQEAFGAGPLTPKETEPATKPRERTPPEPVPAKHSAKCTTPAERTQTENTPVEPAPAVRTSAEQRPADVKRIVAAPPRDGKPVPSPGESDSTSPPEERQPADMPAARPDVVVGLPDHP